MLRVKVLRQDTEKVYGRSKSCCKYLMDVFRKKNQYESNVGNIFCISYETKEINKKIGKNEYQYFEGSSTVPKKGNDIIIDCLLGKNEWWWGGRGQYSFRCEAHVRTGFNLNKS